MDNFSGQEINTGSTVTRAVLADAVYKEIGLSRVEASELVGMFFDTISDSLARFENVKLSSFGSFIVRKKAQRIGRNPKTGVEVPISPRYVMLFKPSNILKSRVNGIDVSDEAE